MLRRHVVLFLFILPGLACFASAQTDQGFRLQAFGPDNSPLHIEGATTYTKNGLLKLTSTDYPVNLGYAFFSVPYTFKNSTNGTAFSFSTTFVTALVPKHPPHGGNGIAFVIDKEMASKGTLPYTGIANIPTMSNHTNSTIFAVELDTFKNPEYGDIDDNHVGVDIHGLVSTEAKSAGYYSAQGFKNMSLTSGKLIQVWVEYDGAAKHINVTIAPIDSVKPLIPLLSLSLDLSPVVQEKMFVGFSAATGRLLAAHYVLGWSFNTNGQARQLDLSKLPKLPKEKNELEILVLKIGVPVLSLCFIFIALAAIYSFLRKRKFAEVLEDWELDYGPHRFKYKDLYTATKGFREQDMLGKGGFGRVYKGVLPNSKMEIAVKRVSHESRQGIKEFVTEIVTLGCLRHRNLVTLLGYCRRKQELLLVYEYMPNGSLDSYLYYNQPKLSLTWTKRFRAIKGVASGLFYLHEEWEKVVIHRDIKASNVLLDSEMNARLGDFGLAKLYNHEAEPQTTHVAGTFGYLAPEYVRSSKATKATDVFAFGIFLLEVACGRKPTEVRTTEDVMLVDWVFTRWSQRQILEARDPNLGMEFNPEEVELVLMLGLLCSHSDKKVRLSMRQVMQYLEDDTPYGLQQLSCCLSLCCDGLTSFNRYAFGNGRALKSPVGEVDAFQVSSCVSVSNSILSDGR